MCLFKSNSVGTAFRSVKKEQARWEKWEGVRWPFVEEGSEEGAGEGRGFYAMADSESQLLLLRGRNLGVARRAGGK